MNSYKIKRTNKFLRIWNIRDYGMLCIKYQESLTELHNLIRNVKKKLIQEAKEKDNAND